MLPIPIITAIKKEFIKLDILKQDKGITITDKGINYVNNNLGFYGLDKELFLKLKECPNMKSVLTLCADELLLIKELLSNRPTVDLAKDQTHCNYITSFKRSLLALKYNTLINKDILCIGDDDLVSVSLGLLLRKLYPDTTNIKTTIHVIDIDKRYLDYINSIASQYQLPITCHNIDLKQALSDKYIDKFDCFYTDPPYTLNGMKLFLSRGISGLKKITGLPIFLSFAHRSHDSSYHMMAEFNRMGLSINRILPRFNEYNGASIIGNIGQLLVLNTTSYTKPSITSEKQYSKLLYTREVRENNREKVPSLL